MNRVQEPVKSPVEKLRSSLVWGGQLCNEDHNANAPWGGHKTTDGQSQAQQQGGSWSGLLGAQVSFK